MPDLFGPEQEDAATDVLHDQTDLCDGRSDACHVRPVAREVLAAALAALDERELMERAAEVERSHAQAKVAYDPATATYAVYFWSSERATWESWAAMYPGFESPKAAAEAVPSLRARAVLRAVGLIGLEER